MHQNAWSMSNEMETCINLIPTLQTSTWWSMPAVSFLFLLVGDYWLWLTLPNSNYVKIGKKIMSEWLIFWMQVN